LPSASGIFFFAEVNSGSLSSSWSGGQNWTTNPTTPNAFQPHASGDASGGIGGMFEDAFVTKFSPAGNTLVYSTYLGGLHREGQGDRRVQRQQEDDQQCRNYCRDKALYAELQDVVGVVDLLHPAHDLVGTVVEVKIVLLPCDLLERLRGKIEAGVDDKGLAEPDQREANERAHKHDPDERNERDENRVGVQMNQRVQGLPGVGRGQTLRFGNNRQENQHG